MENEFYGNIGNKNFTNEINTNSIAQDLFNLNLLEGVVICNTLNLASSVIALIATTNAIKVTKNKYNNTSDKTYNSSELVLIAIYINLVSTLVESKIGFATLDNARERYASGDLSVRVQNSLDINTANMFSMLSTIYNIKVAENVFYGGDGSGIGITLK